MSTDELRRMFFGSVGMEDLIETRITLVRIQELVEIVLCHLSLRFVRFSLPGSHNKDRQTLTQYTVIVLRSSHEMENCIKILDSIVENLIKHFQEDVVCKICLIDELVTAVHLHMYVRVCECAGWSEHHQNGCHVSRATYRFLDNVERP